MNRRALAALFALTVSCFAPQAGAVTSAELVSTMPLRYGRFKARIAMPAGDGIVGSFFLWKSGSEQAGMYWNELDFEKIKADCTMQLNSIFGNPHQDHVSIAAVPGTACVGYHTYAFEWAPDYIAWSVDGTEVRRDANAGAQVYVDNAKQGMLFDFNVWPGTTAFGGNFSAASLPVQEFISWIEYSAYTPGAGDAGSNFTLTWRDSFEGSTLKNDWTVGTWASPLGQSTHSPANVTINNGFAVLSLTADNATGFIGTPPADTGDLPSVSGTAGGGNAGAGGSAGSGGQANTAGAGTGGNLAGSGGSDANQSNSASCSCSTRPSRAHHLASLFAAFGLGFALRRRRTRR